MKVSLLQQVVNDLLPDEVVALVGNHPQARAILVLMLSDKTSNEVAMVLEDANVEHPKRLARTRTALSALLWRRDGRISGPTSRLR